MDYSKKTPSPNSRRATLNPLSSDSQRTSSDKGMEITEEETDENSGPFRGELGSQSQNSRKEPKNFMSTTMSSAAKKKILTEKNDDDATLSDDGCRARFGVITQAKPKVASDRLARSCVCGNRNGACSHPSDSVPYDPLTNYTSPRPQFLRYNPNRRREILMRIEGERWEEEDGSGGDSSLSSDAEKLDAEEPLSGPSPKSLKPPLQDKQVQGSEEEERSDDEDIGVEEEEEEEVVEGRPRWHKQAWKMLLIGVLLFSSYSLSSMNSGFGPSLQEHGGFSEDFVRDRDGELDHRAQNKFPSILMWTLLGLSEVCFNVPRGELTCGIEDNGSSLVFLDESLHEQMQSLHGIEVLTGRNGISTKDDLVGEETIEEAVSSLEQQKCSQGTACVLAGGGNDEIVGAHSSQTGDSHHEPSDSSQASEMQLVDLNSSKDQGGILDLQKAQSMEGAESLWFPQSQIFSSMASDDQKMDRNEVPDTWNTELKWEPIFMFASKNVHQILLLSICLLMFMVSSLLYKSLLKCPKTSASPSLISPAFSPACELEARDKVISSLKAKEHMGENVIDSDVCSKPPGHSSNEGRELAGTRPPVVELLGEFTIVERTAHATGSGRRSRGSEADSAEESQLSQYPNRSTGKNISSSTNKVSTHLLEVSSVVNGSPTVQKPVREEYSGDRAEVVKMTPTPLRRSSRLRNRVTSP